jgi:hypothetical protein
MTADGGTKPGFWRRLFSRPAAPEQSGKEPVWNNNDARHALEDMAQYYAERPLATPRQVRQNVGPDYQLIPEVIREKIEGLSPQEHELLDQILDLLEKNDVYLYTYSRRGATPEAPLGIPELNPVFPTGGY